MQHRKEARIIAECVAYLNGVERCRAVKHHGNVYGSTGEPDIDACYSGICLKLEAKREGKTATDLQAHRLEQWRRAGAVAAVVNSRDDCRAIIEALDAAMPHVLLKLAQTTAKVCDAASAAKSSVQQTQLTPADAIARASRFIVRAKK